MSKLPLQTEAEREYCNIDDIYPDHPLWFWGLCISDPADIAEFRQDIARRISEEYARKVAIRELLDFSKEPSYAELALPEPPAVTSPWELLVAYTTIARSSPEKNEDALRHSYGAALIKEFRECAEKSPEKLFALFEEEERHLKNESFGLARCQCLRDSLASYRALFSDLQNITLPYP